MLNKNNRDIIIDCDFSVKAIYNGFDKTYKVQDSDMTIINTVRHLRTRAKIAKVHVDMLKESAMQLLVFDWLEKEERYKKIMRWVDVAVDSHGSLIVSVVKNDVSDDVVIEIEKVIEKHDNHVILLVDQAMTAYISDVNKK